MGADNAAVVEFYERLGYVDQQVTVLVVCLANIWQYAKSAVPHPGRSQVNAERRASLVT